MPHAPAADDERLRDRQGEILEAFFQHTQTCLVLLDRDFNFLRVNEAYARACHRDASEFAGHNHFELYPSALIEDFRRVVASKEPWSTAARPFVFPDHPEWGTTYWDLALVPILDAAGDVAYLVFSLHDVTPIVRAETALSESEERYRQAQKMESIGRLAGGVAHDFNNLLTAIHAYTALALHTLPADSPGRADLQEVLKAAERAAALTRQLLAFSRQQVLQRSVVSLDRIIGDLEGMLRRLIGEHIDLRVVTRPDLRPVLVDPSQIEQVVMNLAVNARDAMPEGGELTLSTQNVALDAAQAEVLGLREGPYVRLSVSDTGAGMDESTRARVFEPFFTTKAEGKGTGLGLSMVHGIVVQSGGAVVARSELGKGSTFEVHLPAHIGAAIEPAPPAPRARPTEGHGTVLVVEDDAAVRALVERVLRAAGYVVLSATNGVDALALGEREPRAIDLLVTDVIMPRLSGAELATRLQATRPSIKVLYMSGYASDAFGAHFETPAGGHFVPKPLTPEGLLEAVGAALAET